MVKKYKISWRDRVNWDFCVVTDDLVTSVHLEAVLSTSKNVIESSVKREVVEDVRGN